MKDLFFKIPQEKRDCLIRCTTAEFAAHTFNNASINSIIESAGISKGGLFKYIDSKQDLYLHVMEMHLKHMISLQQKEMACAPADLFARIRHASGITLAFYQASPDVYRMLNHAFMDTGSAAYAEVMKLRADMTAESRDVFLAGIDWSLYRLDRAQMLRVFNWMNLGLSSSVYLDRDVGEILAELELMLDCLRYGVMKDSTEVGKESAV